MNEEQWLTCKKTAVLLRYLRSLTGSRWRRWMLFNCACCRRIWGLVGKGGRMFIETVERHADDLPPLRRRVLWEWEKKAQEEPFSGPWLNPDHRACRAAASAAVSVKREDNSTAEEAAIAVARLRRNGGILETKEAEQSAQCNILRDIFGNPFRRSATIPSWLSWNDSIVVRLAQAAYAERILPTGTLDNTRLLILADALEEAGCIDEQILTHLRSGGEHYRGCWVIDLLLGKE